MPARPHHDFTAAPCPAINPAAVNPAAVNPVIVSSLRGGPAASPWSERLAPD